MSGQEQLQGLEVFPLFQARRAAASTLLGSRMAVGRWEHVASQPKDPRACLSLSRTGSHVPGPTARHVRHFGELLHDVIKP